MGRRGCKELHPGHRGEQAIRVCVVGPSAHFLSGITHYTFGLCDALAQRVQVSSILLRRLLPHALYPGRRRVGKPLSGLHHHHSIPTYDGVDWYWLPSMLRALIFLRRQCPQVLVLQWWTGTVLHSYVALAFVARLLGARVVIEFHEALDTGEDRLRWARMYVSLVAPLLFRMASGFVVHSRFDRDLVAQRYSLASESTAVIPHATYAVGIPPRRRRLAPRNCVNILYFGVIRPFKGVEDLLEAFAAIPEEEINRYWLTVVGETWEGWTRPAEMIAAHRYRERISFINEYVADEEVDALFLGADTVVLPYHRCSQSGPLHLSMHYGLPVVTTAVGGIVEAVSSYAGVILVEPHSPQSLLAGIRQAVERGQAYFPAPHLWPEVAAMYADFLLQIIGAQPGGSDRPRTDVIVETRRARSTESSR